MALLASLRVDCPPKFSLSITMINNNYLDTSSTLPLSSPQPTSSSMPNLSRSRRPEQLKTSSTTNMLGPAYLTSGMYSISLKDHFY